MAKTTLKILTSAVMILAGSLAIRAQEADVATQLVDVMNKLFGVHPGFRAQHAKGVVADGSFTATPVAATLSKAAIFTGAKIPVTVRFSDNTGIPDVPDGLADANPHGIAIKYHLPDGNDMDMVTNSLHFFPVATGEDFLALLTAVSKSPTDAPHPTAVEQFVATHPSVPLAFATAHTPDSFAHEEYYGINAFVFVNKAGAKQAVRYQIVPEKTVYLDPKGRRLTAWTSREGFCERDGEAFSDRRDRVFDVAFGADRRRLGVDNRRVGEASCAAGGGIASRSEIKYP